VEYQRPLDLSSGVLAGAESLDHALEETRRTHELATIIDAEEIADFTTNKVLDRGTHLVLRFVSTVLPILIALDVTAPSLMRNRPSPP
jgi:hypothetical protein